MRLGYVMMSDLVGEELLLSRMAEALKDARWRVCGAVQVNARTWDDHRCDMDIQVLPHGEALRISQSLGPVSKGCRLDTSALECAVALAEAELLQGADVLILNKFGKHEADGRGFRNLIADALAKSIPVIVGMNEKNLPAFLKYCEGMAQALPPDIRVMKDWLETQSRNATAA